MSTPLEGNVPEARHADREDSKEGTETENRIGARQGSQVLRQFSRRRRSMEFTPINKEFRQLFSVEKRNFKLLDQNEDVLVNDSILFLDEQCLQYDELELNYVHDRLKVIDNSTQDPVFCVATPGRPHRNYHTDIREFRSPLQSTVRAVSNMLEIDTPSQVNLVDDEPALLSLLDEAKIDFSSLREREVSRPNE